MTNKIDANVVEGVLSILRKSIGFNDSDKLREAVIEAVDYSKDCWCVRLDNSKLPYVGFSIGYPAADQLNHVFLSKNTISFYFDKEPEDD